MSADLLPQASVTCAQDDLNVAVEVLWEGESTDGALVPTVDFQVSTFLPLTVEQSSPSVETPTSLEDVTSPLDLDGAQNSDTSSTDSGTRLPNTSEAEALPHYEGRTNAITEQLIDTLHVANGPPAPALHLSEMRPVDTDLRPLQGQLIYLDFDGELGLSYRGPVRVDGVEVSAFRAPGDLAGQETALIGSTLSTLNEQFATLGVRFTSARPGAGIEYSTIYVGGDGSAFSRYGSFLGLAEKVDAGNRDRADNALVFSDRLRFPGMTAEAYVSVLAEIIEHEALHLLGYGHADASGSAFEQVAAEAAADFLPVAPAGSMVSVSSQLGQFGSAGSDIS